MQAEKPRRFGEVMLVTVGVMLAVAAPASGAKWYTCGVCIGYSFDSFHGLHAVRRG